MVYVDPSQEIDNNKVSMIEELKELGKAIKELRSEISKIQTDDSQRFEFTNAHDELDSVIETASVATNEILDRAEKIESLKNHFMGDHQVKLLDYITRIYESCGFQDLSGQRIRKVMKIIRDIESDLDDIFKNYTIFLEMKQNANCAENDEQVNFKIVRELYNLNMRLSKAKQEMATVQGVSGKHAQFNAAKDELHEVSKSAEKATHVILTSAEEIEKMNESLPAEHKQVAQECVVKIYEECAFHDLIGQRISKVMKALSLIDHALCNVFGGVSSNSAEDSNEDILVLENGPQLPKQAPTQDIIDSIFNTTIVN